MQTTVTGIGRHNVGRIAERIVSNELEFHGFRVSDLNKEGTSVNADLLAARNGQTWQILVKGASMGPDDTAWWFNYGYCKEETVQQGSRMFNTAEGFYHAQYVVLVAVRTPRDYCCLVLPEADAETAAQMNLDYSLRAPLSNGGARKPGKVWTYLDYVMKTRSETKRKAMIAEQAFLKPFKNQWDLIGSS